MIYVYVFLIILLLIVYELYYQKEHIVHFMSGNSIDIPTPQFILNKVIDILYYICRNENKQFTLIDIGSGSGKTIDLLCKDKQLKKCKGIELDKNIHKLAQKRIKNKKVYLINTDATKINYPKDYPSSEPLRRCPNIQRIKKEFSYKPKISLKEGLILFKKYAENNF